MKKIVGSTLVLSENELFLIGQVTIKTILTDFNYATLTSPYIFQKTVECKLPLFRCCHHELASSANTLVLIVKLNWTTLFASYEFSHFNIP